MRALAARLASPGAPPRAEVLGVVVDVQLIKQSLVRFSVDDGSGLATCCLWLNDNAPAAAGTHHVPDVVAARVEAAQTAEYRELVAVGRLLRVQGRVTRWNGENQLTVASLQEVADANAEVLHWADCINLERLAAGEPGFDGALP